MIIKLSEVKVASPKVPQNISIILIPCLKKPMYISPAPGISEQIKSKSPFFCFVILNRLRLRFYLKNFVYNQSVYQSCVKALQKYSVTAVKVFPGER